MPTWTAENDLKLASAIIALHQVKVNKDDCDRLAEIIGDGCTAKAVTHRVAKFREAASKLGLQASTAAPATPPSAKKRARKAKAGEDGDGDGAEGMAVKKPRTPRIKKSAARIEDDVANEETIKEEPIKKEPTNEENTEASA